MTTLQDSEEMVGLEGHNGFDDIAARLEAEARARGDEFPLHPNWRNRPEPIGDGATDQEWLRHEAKTARFDATQCGGTAKGLKEAEGYQAISDRYERIAAALDAAEQRTSSDVKVKALEWSEPDHKNFGFIRVQAQTPFGGYEIEWLVGQTNYAASGPLSFHNGEDLETVKGLCEADYRSRILSALQNGGGDA